MIVCVLKISEMLFYPLLFAALTGLFFCVYKTKQTWLHFTFYAFLFSAILWRGGYVGGISKRYACILLVPAALLAVFAFAKLYQLAERKRWGAKWLVCGLFLLCIGIQVGKIFHSDPHQDLVLLRQKVRNIQAKEPGAALVIYSKEQHRLGGVAYPFVYALPVASQTSDGISAYLERMRYWGAPVYFIRLEASNDAFLSEKDLKIPPGASFTLCEKYDTDRHHRGRLTMYRYLPEAVRIPDSVAVENDRRNLISNGDMEILMPKETQKERMKCWIEGGALCYDPEASSLPACELLLPTWNKAADYPRVFADAKNPLRGKYSLHVQSDNKTAIYLMQCVPAVPGILSWRARALTADVMIWLSRYDYDDAGKIHYPPMEYWFYLPEKQDRLIRVDLSKEKFLGKKSLFLLHFSDAEVLLDDICYVPTVEKEVIK